MQHIENIIDFRSDTVTLPTEEMRQAAASADVGDDVFGEDPSVNMLEKEAAAITGKEEAVFVPSGTMGNLISVLVHCGRGDEALLGDQSHIFLNEGGGIAVFGGIHPRPLQNRPDGTISPEDILSSVRGDDPHHPNTRLLCLENTHNFCGGAALTPSYMKEACDAARRGGLSIHLDGARIFNAASALGIDVSELTSEVDSVSFCLSKGLSAPVGSLVCGSGEFIEKARRLRKVIGGSMRQAGIIAAPGLVALRKMTGRLAEDHRLAGRLARGLARIPYVEINPEMVETNIIFFRVTHPNMTADEFVSALANKGIGLLSVGPSRLRMVTHRHISEKNVDTALEAVDEILRKTPVAEEKRNYSAASKKNRPK